MHQFVVQPRSPPASSLPKHHHGMYIAVKGEDACTWSVSATYLFAAGIINAKVVFVTNHGSPAGTRTTGDQPAEASLVVEVTHFS